MTLTIEFPPGIDHRLQQAAEVQGVDPVEYVRRLVEQGLADEEDAATRTLFAAWEAEDATDDPSELAAGKRNGMGCGRISKPIPYA